MHTRACEPLIARASRLRRRFKRQPIQPPRRTARRYQRQVPARLPQAQVVHIHHAATQPMRPHRRRVHPRPAAQIQHRWNPVALIAKPTACTPWPTVQRSPHPRRLPTRHRPRRRLLRRLVIDPPPQRIGHPLGRQLPPTTRQRHRRRRAFGRCPVHLSQPSDHPRRDTAPLRRRRHRRRGQRTARRRLRQPAPILKHHRHHQPRHPHSTNRASPIDRYTATRGPRSAAGRV